MIPKYKPRCAKQANGRIQVIPAQWLLHVPYGKTRKHAHGDDFLDNLELPQSKNPITKAIGRDLQRVLEKGNAPTHQDDYPQRRFLQVLEVAIPGKGHKNIGAKQQQYGFH